MIGCAKPTGQNCNSQAPCCEHPMQPTLTSADQISYQNFSIKLPSETLFAEGFETTKPVSGKLRGSSGFKDAKSFSQILETDPYKFNPWLAPGHAPVASPCGILGGWRYASARDYIAGPGEGYAKFVNHTGGPTNVDMPPPNMSTPVGTKGTDALMYDLNERMQEAQGKPYRTNDNAKWKAGGIQEVSYAVVANHGGGMQYRICKLDNLFNDSMTEECFQSTPLNFVGDTSWFQYNSTTATDTTTNRIPFTAVRVNDANTDGVLPKGSTWTKIGIPACAGAAGGAISEGHCAKPQFENELTKAGFWGFGPGSENSPAFQKVLGSYSIVDKVQVPEGLDGDYVLSWRWDSEQTAQVWTQCSVVTIEA